MNRLCTLPCMGQRILLAKHGLLKRPGPVLMRPRQMGAAAMSTNTLIQKLSKIASALVESHTPAGRFKLKNLIGKPRIEHKLDDDSFKRFPLTREPTPQICDMIASGSKLETTLSILEQLQPKVQMTLGDRLFIQHIVTEKLYSKIIHESDVFSSTMSHENIHLRLSREGTLVESVRPVIESKAIQILMDDLAAVLDYMTAGEILKLFYNLQFVDWPKDSEIIFKIYDHLQGIDVTTLRIEEFLTYCRAWEMYNPNIHSRNMYPLMCKWFDKNISQETNDSDLIALVKIFLKILSDGKIIYQRSYSRQDTLLRRLDNILDTLERKVVLRHLSLSDSLVLSKVHIQLEGKGVYCSTIYLGSPRRLPSKVRRYQQSVVQRVMQNITNMDDSQFCCNLLKINKVALKLMDRTHKELIAKRCMQILSQKNLKCGETLHMLNLLQRTSDEKVVSNAAYEMQELNSIQKADITSLLEYAVRQKNLSDHVRHTILDRIKEHVQAGLIDRDISVRYISRKCLQVVFEINSSIDRKDVALEVRDKIIEHMLRTDSFDPYQQNTLLTMCLMLPQITPTCMEFIEHLTTGNWVITKTTFNHLRHLGSRVIGGYHVNIPASLFYRLNTSFTLLLYHSIKYKPLDNSFSSSHWEDTVFKILITELYKHQLDPEIKCLNYNLARPYAKPSKELLESLLHVDLGDIKLFNQGSLIADSFFNDGGKGDMKNYWKMMLRLKFNKDYAKQMENKITPKARLPLEVRNCVKKAFKGKVGHGSSTDLFDLLVLINKNGETVEYSPEMEKQAKELGLTKVAIFYHVSSSLPLASQRTKNEDLVEKLDKMKAIMELKELGYKCVVIWDSEWHSIANRTFEEKVNLIRSKVQDTSSVNTAPVVSYDINKLKKGPYKEFFMKV